MKKIYIVIIIVFTLLMLSLYIGYRMIYTDKHIEDTNGEITTLESIDIGEMLVQNYSSYSAYMSSKRYSGDSTGIVGRLERQKTDFDIIRFSTKKLSGIMIAQTTNCNKNDNLTFTIDSTLISGNMEIVVVAPDNTLVQNVQVNTKQTIHIANTQEGVYKVVIGAESAELNIEVHRKILST